ncbi:MAG: ComEC/Rec2 family competence protein [Dongiaceae bacterium]
MSGAEQRAGLASLIATNLSLEQERWMLWCPVFLATGIGFYFALPEEPPLWLGSTVFGLSAVAIIAGRSLPILKWLLAVLIAASLGFAAAQWRTVLIAAPVLTKEQWADVSGQVLDLEVDPPGARITLDHVAIAGVDSAGTPARIRVRLPASVEMPSPGDWLALRAKLGPSSRPVLPGGFDFQRLDFFRQVGAVGIATRDVRRIDAPGGVGLRTLGELWATAWREISAIRVAIAQRILTVLSDDRGTIAVALIAGDQYGISDATMDDMRDSGLAHLLSISGLHILLVTTILFGGFRLLLAALERIALYWPIKKWAAGLAFIGAGFYVLLAGAPVPTVRSFIMAGIFLLGIMFDRDAISMRTVAIAAVIVLLIGPEGLTGASLQMSFAAVIALIALYEVATDRQATRTRDPSWTARILRYVVMTILASLVASMATAPFALYHFNRPALYGVAANLAAVPLTSIWIMPWAVAAAMAMPFGLEALALVPMGWGIEGIMLIADTVAGWPGAAQPMPGMPLAGLITVAIGGLWLCLWRRRWRWLGLPVLLLGLLSTLLVRQPDILVSEDGDLMAIRDSSGGYLLSSLTRSKFEREIWLRRAGLESGAIWPAEGYSQDGGLACDSQGCIHRIHGLTVALALEPAALQEDCRRADIVISVDSIRVVCAVPTRIDWRDRRRNGAYALWIDDDGVVEIVAVDDLRGRRPWVAGNGPLSAPDDPPALEIERIQR